jgi:hypothetical protein
VANDKGDGEDLFEDLDKFFAPIKDVDWDEPEGEPERTPPASHVEVHPEQAPAATEDEASTDAGDADEEPVEDVWYDAGTSEPVDALGEPQPSDAEVVVLDEGDVPALPGGMSAPETAPTDEDLEAAAAHFAGSLGDEGTYQTEPIDVIGDPRSGDLLSDLGAGQADGPDDVEHDLLSDLDAAGAPPRTVVVGGEGMSGPSWQEPAGGGGGGGGGRGGSRTKC